MYKPLFDGLMLSLNQAVAITKGEMKPSRTFTYEVTVSDNDLPESIKVIREKTGLTQEAFTEKLQPAPK